MCPLSFSSIRYLVNHYFKLPPFAKGGLRGIYLFYTNILIDILSISKLFDGDIFSMVSEIRFSPEKGEKGLFPPL
jgi:hypothetical protein